MQTLNTLYLSKVILKHYYTFSLSYLSIKFKCMCWYYLLKKIKQNLQFVKDIYIFFLPAWNNTIFNIFCNLMEHKTIILKPNKKKVTGN